jgi:hypothetical protein
MKNKLYRKYGYRGYVPGPGLQRLIWLSGLALSIVVLAVCVGYFPHVASAPPHASRPKVTAPVVAAIYPAPVAPPAVISKPAAPPAAAARVTDYPWHANIMASMFYVGEAAGPENANITNTASAWDEQWQAHYGGVDDPQTREQWYPVAFVPKQNPFYIALPYNDLNDQGARKSSAAQVYWAAPAAAELSIVQHRWVQVCRGAECAYGQWEDAGPLGEDDVPYVFGSARPANRWGLKAGIDVSPAIDDFLRLAGEATVSWRFIDASAVPPGPWRQIITK